MPSAKGDYTYFPLKWLQEYSRAQDEFRARLNANYDKAVAALQDDESDPDPYKGGDHE